MVAVSNAAFSLILWALLAWAAGDELTDAPPTELIDDIIRPEIIDDDTGAAITGLYTRVSPKQKWAGGVLHWEYQADNNFTNTEKLTIAASMDQLAASTCMKFAPRTNQTGYVYIRNNETGCHATLGYMGRPQSLHLGSGCVSKKVVMHELMHSMGFEHEQTRYDRDMYLQIMWENIKINSTHNFNKHPRTMSFPRYRMDFRSIMMYGLKFFTNNSLPTMRVLKNPDQVPDAEVGNSKNLTNSDVLRIQSAYKCTLPTNANLIAELERLKTKNSQFSNFF